MSKCCPRDLDTTTRSVAVNLVVTNRHRIKCTAKTKSKLNTLGSQGLDRICHSITLPWRAKLQLLRRNLRRASSVRQLARRRERRPECPAAEGRNRQASDMYPSICSSGTGFVDVVDLNRLCWFVGCFSEFRSTRKLFRGERLLTSTATRVNTSAARWWDRVDFSALFRATLRLLFQCTCRRLTFTQKS